MRWSWQIHQNRLFQERLALSEAEAAKDLRRDFPDSACADNANGLAGDVETDQPGEREVVFADAVPSAVNLTIQREQQPDGVFGHGMGRIRWHADNGQPQRLRRSQVHIVEPRTAQGHEPHAGAVKLLQARTVEAVVDEHADGLRAIRAGSGRTGEAEFMKLPAQGFAAGVPEILAVVRFGVVEGSIHKCFNLETAVDRHVQWDPSAAG